MSDDTYNGWVNRETWATALHLSNNPDLYGISTMIVKEEDERQTEWRADLGWQSYPTPIGQFAADRFEDWIDAAVSDFLHADTSSPDAWASNHWIRMMISDVGSFDRVDWLAVADSFRDS